MFSIAAKYYSPHTFVSMPFSFLELLNYPNSLTQKRKLWEGKKKLKMEFDLENPLTSFKEQQNSAIFELFASESDHMPSQNTLSSFYSTECHSSFRSEAISLILQVKFSCNLDPLVAYLAINYLDRFMSSQEIPQGKPWLLKLIVISCLSLSLKMKNKSFSLAELQEEGCIFEAESIKKMELLILGALKWRMRSITPFSFLDFFISLAEFKESSLKKVVKERTSEIIFNAHYDMKFSEFKPSIIAASAIISACLELFPLQYFTLRTSISACECVNEDMLSKCFKLMQEMVRMEGKESMLDTTASISSTETPVSVLQRNTKRRRIDIFCCRNQVQISEIEKS